MRYAMIARLVNDTPHAIGTIDMDSKGFIFETEDNNLKKILKEVQRKGVLTMVGGVHKKDFIGDLEDYVKITEDTSGKLQAHLEENGYYWWEDRS